MTDIYQIIYYTCSVILQLKRKTTIKMKAERLKDLIVKLQYNIASDDERREYMGFMLIQGKITKEQYDKFIKGETTDRFLKLTLIIGGAILFGMGLEDLKIIS